MNIRQLFSKKTNAPKVNQSNTPQRMKVDSLDHCVGGRMETDDVSCYLRHTQPGGH